MREERKRLRRDLELRGYQEVWGQECEDLKGIEAVDLEWR